MITVRNKVVLITGAGRGLGAAIAEAFAAEGAIVAANDITPINLNKVIKRISDAGGRAKSYVYDISKKMPIQAMMNSILDDFGRLDIIINAASVNPKANILTLDAWDWQRTLDVNLTGTFLITQSAGRIMAELGGGSIINIAVNHKSNHQAAYVVSKMGIIGLTEESAHQFSGRNIHINAIYSGSKTAIQKSARTAEEIKELVTRLSLALCGQNGSKISGAILDIEKPDTWEFLIEA
ncbi:MAG: SDR family NAD(P)-dependent oxidoreductase [Chloroflexota bacterium]